jgi:hypothetical protein
MKMAKNTLPRVEFAAEFHGQSQGSRSALFNKHVWLWNMHCIRRIGDLVRLGFVWFEILVFSR